MLDPPRKVFSMVLVSSGSGSRGGGEIFLIYPAKALSDRGPSAVVWVHDHRRMDESRAFQRSS
jgi:hypothetical protein